MSDLKKKLIKLFSYFNNYTPESQNIMTTLGFSLFLKIPIEILGELLPNIGM